MLKCTERYRNPQRELRLHSLVPLTLTAIQRYAPIAADEVSTCRRGRRDHLRYR